MSLAITITLTCAAIAGAYALVNWDDPRPGLLDAIPWPRLPRPRKRDGGRFAWKLWRLLIRSRRVCPANAHSALIWHTKPLREIFINWMCRSDSRDNGHCWCGKLQAASPKTPPRAHGGTGEPCTGHGEPHETGARRLITRVHGWLYPATGQHSAAVLRLGVDGLWHDAATGPFTIPADYGTTVTAAERMWRGLP